MRTASASTVSAEARTLRAVAIRIVPLLMALYFVNYLDRTNLGIAKTDISADLQLSATLFGLASGIFFIGYILVEVPSNLVLQRFGARRWLARIAISWGIVTIAIGFAPNATTLLILRFFLGIAEAGFLPGVIYYLSRWFPRTYRVRIMALFLMAIPISTVIGIPVAAWLITIGNGVFGLAGWQFMMICTGSPAVLLGILCWLSLPDTPADASWLSDPQRQWLMTVMAEEENTINEYCGIALTRALRSPRIWALALVLFGIGYGFHALVFFLPAIITGFTETFDITLTIIDVGLITAIPYGCAAVAMYLWSRHAERTHEHIWHVALPMTIGGLAIPVALYLNSPVLAMIPVIITAMALFSALPSFWALPSQFLTGAAAAGSIALINSIGSLSGVVAPYAMGAFNDLTGDYKVGMWIIGIMMLLSAALIIIVRATPQPPQHHVLDSLDHSDSPATR